MPPTATPPKTARLLTVDEVARALRCSRDTVYRRIDDGQLRALRVGESGPFRVRSVDVERLLRPAHDRNEGA